MSESWSSSPSGGTTSEAVTRDIRVRVESFFVPERSSTSEGYYFFAYRVEIANLGDETMQLLSRSWTITNGDGEQQQVNGPGVVGEQPVLVPGASFEYTSFCPLRTQVGSMHGTYQMVSADGERFDAEIAAFTLAVPHAVN